MTDRPGLPEVDGYDYPSRLVEHLIEKAYDAGRLHANEQIKSICLAHSDPRTNPGAQALANQVLRILGERGEAK